MIQIPSFTVAELHQQLQSMIDRGLGNVPVVATDCRAFYPFQAYPISSTSGYVSEFLIYVRPDAHFAERSPLPTMWGESRISEYNAQADKIKAGGGAFSDSHLQGFPSRYGMLAALEKIWNSGHPAADQHLPELRGLTEGKFSDHLVRIAGEALGRA